MSSFTDDGTGEKFDFDFISRGNEDIYSFNLFKIYIGLLDLLNACDYVLRRITTFSQSKTKRRSKKIR